MQDRLGLSSVCLAICAALYAALSSFLHGQTATFGIAWLGFAAYALSVYVVVMFLGIELRRWAWKACTIVLCLHLVMAPLVLVRLPVSAIWAVLIAVFWCFPAVLGLWANLRSASRVVVRA